MPLNKLKPLLLLLPAILVSIVAGYYLANGNWANNNNNSKPPYKPAKHGTQPHRVLYTTRASKAKALPVRC